MSLQSFVKNSTFLTKILLAAMFCLVVWGFTKAYKKLFPEKVANTEIVTKATGLPPLAYDKGSNAPLRALPSFDEPASVQGPEIRLLPFGWNGFSAASYVVGGKHTAKGSLAEELGLNISLDVNNSTTEQLNQLRGFIDAYHSGDHNPSKGVHGIILMGDAWFRYGAGFNAALHKAYGPDYNAKVYTFTGASFGEDKWQIDEKYRKDPRGSLTATVIGDGDWNTAIIKCQLMGWPVNNIPGTYDRTKVNFVDAPNGDYIESGKMYIAKQKVPLHIVENGKLTGKDTSVQVDGVASWFPVDAQVVEKRGKTITLASTKDFATQMPCAIILFNKWADENTALVEKMIEAFAKGGDQIKSHDEALRFATKVNALVFNDQQRDADAWYKAFVGYDYEDEYGNVVNLGGTRAFNMADVAAYTGVSGGTDIYRKVFETFGHIVKEAHPDLVPDTMTYEDAVDFSMLKSVYNRMKNKGEAGTISKTDFASAQKGTIAGNASYSIQFATGSAQIKPESYAVLKEIGNQLAIANNLFVEIGGHTDNTGNPEKNLTLSEQRAEAVRQYLMQNNDDLEASRVSSKGYGDTRPLGADLAKNRRVEIKLYRPQ